MLLMLLNNCHYVYTHVFMMFFYCQALTVLHTVDLTESYRNLLHSPPLAAHSQGPLL